MGFDISSEHDFLFVHPQLYFVSTAMWKNQGREICRQHEADDFAISEAVSQMAEQFEGWGLSVDYEDCPRSASEIMRYLPQYVSAGQISNAKSGRPRKVEGLVPTMKRLYPDGIRPSWKMLAKAVNAESGDFPAEATLRRAWTAYMAETLPTLSSPDE